MIETILGLSVAAFALVWALFRASGRIARTEEAQQDAEAALETTRRIEDATRDLPDPDDARERLRQFGGGTSGQR